MAVIIVPNNQLCKEEHNALTKFLNENGWKESVETKTDDGFPATYWFKRMVN